MGHYLMLVGVVAFFCACGGMFIFPKIMPKHENSAGIGCCLGTFFGVLSCLGVTFWVLWRFG